MDSYKMNNQNLQQLQTHGSNMTFQNSHNAAAQSSAESLQASQTFIFSQLPPEEKAKFMDFLINNHVDFSYDQMDSSYMATIKIVNKQNGQEEDIIDGFQQMRQKDKASPYQTMNHQSNQQTADTSILFNNQIQDLTKFQNRLKSLDEANDLAINYDAKQQSRNGDFQKTNLTEQPSSARRHNQKPSYSHRQLAQNGQKKATTSQAQLQIYLRPEFTHFTQYLNPKNPQSIRPKRHNLLNLLRLIEDLYAYKFGKGQTQNKSGQDKMLFESVVDYFNQKYKQKLMCDQAAFDLLASIDSYKQQSQEVDLFYRFFIGDFHIKELFFYLYVRSLAERELSIVITKLPSNQDIRSIKLPVAKALKIAKIYFQNALNADAEGHQQQAPQENPDMVAENFIGICVEDANIEDQFDQKLNSMALTFFLVKLLKEFQHQDISNAIEQQRSNSATPNEQQFFNDINFENKNGEQKQEEQHNGPPQNHGGQEHQQQHQMNEELEQKEVDLLNKMQKYIVGNKVNQMISIMLQSYQDGLSKEVIDMIKEEIKSVMGSKIQMLLQAAYIDDDTQWFKLLQVSAPDDDQLEQFQCTTESLNSIIDVAQYNPEAEDPVQIPLDLLEGLAKTILSASELRMEFGELVSSLTLQAKRGLETDESEIDLKKFHKSSAGTLGNI